MKAKHIITTCGVIVGGLAVAGSASAVVTYKGSSEVQFTFAPILSLDLSDNSFAIGDLTPGSQDTSPAVTATVSTNSSAGYILSATVGNSTYNTRDLTSTTNTSKFAMMSSGTSLTSGTWGYTTDGTKFGALPLYSDTTSGPAVLNKTVNASGQGADSYPGGMITNVRIGAYANPDQLPGTYSNVVNLIVTANIAARTVDLEKGIMPGDSTTNVASVSLNNSATNLGSFEEGTTVPISATCSGASTFAGWSKNHDFGTIADASSANTTYTVGAGDVIITAYCSN